MALGSHLITVRRLEKYINDVIGKKANLPNTNKTIIGNISQINSDLTQEVSRATSQENVLSTRIDQIASLPSGSTSGDAELMDIRVGADGKTYNTAGDAVREQIGILNSDIYLLSNPEDISRTWVLHDGFISSTLNVESSETYKYTEPILLKNGCRIELTTWAYRGVVSTITRYDMENVEKRYAEVLALSKGNDNGDTDIYTYDNLSGHDIYIVLCGRLDTTHPIMNGYIKICNIKEYTYNKLEIDNKLPYEQGLKIVHMGDSTTCLLDYPSLIKDGNIHYNVSANGAKIIKEEGKLAEGKSFIGLLEAKLSGDYTKVDAVIDDTKDSRVKTNLTLFKNIDFGEIDKLVFYLGNNDFISDSVIGNSDSTSLENVIPALKWALKTLAENYPLLQLYCVNIGYIHKEYNDLNLKLEDYSNAIKSVCEEFNVPILDMCKCGGVNQYNYTSKLVDIVHPNDTQNKKIAYMVRNFMMS